MIKPSAQRLVLAAILLVTVALGARGITDESSVMLGGDMARYVMDGVFLHDLIEPRRLELSDLEDYAERYYARYPALSLGHHPPLLFVALVPFFAIFGVSLFAARLTALTFFVFAAWGLYSLAKRTFGWQAASWATLLFVTNVYVLRSGQYLLSEMPMVAFVLASINALLTYGDTQKAKHFAWFVACAVASLYAKQLAIFMAPVYIAVLVTRLGWRSLLRRHVVILTLTGTVLVAPLAAATLALSPDNVRSRRTLPPDS
jgi:4-amino-4-deoxy-L-arabinose transferase-like glycosyltransferase